VGVYLLFVWTRDGQRWDDAVWYGHTVQDGDYLLAAKGRLRALSLPVIIAASALLCLTAWARWGLRAGVVIGAFLVGTLLSAEVLKHWLLPRPDLHDFDPLEKAHNTLPSGHTTIGAMVAVGFILVMPRRVRGIVAVIAFAFAAQVGGSTLAAGWHRPSDAIAAYLLVGFATCLVVGLMLRRGSARLLGPEELGRMRGWSVVVWVVPALGALLLWAAVAATRTVWPLIVGDEPITGWTATALDSAFTAGLLADYGAAAVVFTLLYLLLRRVELGVPAEDWHRWHRRQDARAAFESLPPQPAAAVSPPDRVTLLPESTRDESDIGWGDDSGEIDYLRERPPHHGD